MLSRTVLALSVALFLPVGASASADCVGPALAAEREYGLPRGLAVAVALVESGRGGTPHPFALNVGGRAHYPATLGQAASTLREGQRLGGNAMVGCMQLSYVYHRAEFPSVETMLDPRENVRYGARYLAALKRDTGNWTAALRRYNGGSAERQQKYLCAVKASWTTLNPAAAAAIEAPACPSGPVPVVSASVRRDVASATPPMPPRPPKGRKAGKWSGQSI